VKMEKEKNGGGRAKNRQIKQKGFKKQNKK
jgi:hypothetical protein